MTQQRKGGKPQMAPVDDYAERPLKEALADPDDLVAAENRQPDQIEDYHEKNPTLKPLVIDDDDEAALKQKAAEDAAKAQQDMLPDA